MLNDILKNMSLFVDGRGYAGNVDELNLPKLALKTEEFRGCLLYTSPSPRDKRQSRMPSSA